MADPRALQDSISRQRGLIPPSEDQFFGQQMSRQPSIVESILKYLYNPTDPGMQPIGLAMPMAAGLVASEKNFPIIFNKMKQAGAWDSRSPGFKSNIEYALKYMRAKYPKIFNLPDAYYSYPAEMAKDAPKGTYYPGSNSVVINPKLGGADTIETAGHEMTHAIQKARGYDFSNYIPAEVDFEKYFRQPAEVSARQGGRTTINTYNKMINGIIEYLRLHPDQLPPSQK